MAPFPVVESPLPNSYPQPGVENVIPGPGFKLRLYVVAYAMHSLKSVRHSVTNEGRHSVGQLWIGRLHDTVYPLNGMEENISLVSSLPDHASLVEGVLAQIRDEMTGSDFEVPCSAEFTTPLIRNLALTALLDRQMLDRYDDQQPSLEDFTEFTRLHGCSTRTQSLAVDLLQFFRAKFLDSLSRGVYAL
ncbi:hypothetical protein FRC06_007576, partial [Ceratobasidium sp. 370]